jgi:thiol:disulfide interchange protein DsbD
MRRPLAALLALLLALAAAPPAGAGESAPVRSPRATATLVADAAAVAPGEAFRLGLRLRLAPGWHTYWRNPGDAGAAPEITLSLPEGATAGPIAWPAPERIPFGPLVNFGYTGEVLLPLPATAPAAARPGETLRITAEATWLVCEQVCIPEEGRFTLDLPVAAPPGRVDAALAPLFTRAEAALPRPSPWTATAGFRGRQGSLALTGPDLSPATVRGAAFFPDEAVLDNTAPHWRGPRARRGHRPPPSRAWWFSPMPPGCAPPMPWPHPWAPWHRRRASRCGRHCSGGSWAASS